VIFGGVEVFMVPQNRKIPVKFKMANAIHTESHRFLQNMGYSGIVVRKAAMMAGKPVAQMNIIL
jgi:hypothetical protein